MDCENEELARLSVLIGLIYEGATDPSRWARDILPAVAEYIQAPACILYTNYHTPQNGGYSFFYGITQEHFDLYGHKYYDKDLWKIAITEKNLITTGNVIIGDEVVPRTKLLASSFYEECLSRNANMVQLITGCVFGVDSTHSMPSALSFFRGSHQPDFGEEHRARVRLVLPHVSRSLGVMQRLRFAELTMATTLDALNRLSSGIILLDNTGQVAFANRSAKRLLEDQDGLRLRNLTHRSGCGELVAGTATVREAISEAISSTLARDPYDTPHFSRCIIAPRTSGSGRYTLQISALGGHNEFGSGHAAYSAIIFIADSEQAVEIDTTALQNFYGLTKAESMVAVALFEAGSAKEVALKLGTTPNTVRNQIQHIYDKLGVDTIARFVKLILGLFRI
jgi:DNA-binding CsgD family transcriptional regulator